MGNGPEKMTRGPYKARPTEGTVADLIVRFRGSPQYRGWQPTTKQAAERVLSAFMLANGRNMVGDLRRGHIVSMRDELADRSSAANHWLKIVNVLLNYAVEIEMVTANVAATVQKLTVPNPDGHRTWREDEIATFLSHHGPGTLPRRVFLLALCTGAARCDLVRLGPGNLRGDRIVYRRMKMRGKPAPEVNIPILRELAEELAALPPRPTFLHTIRGRARSEKSLGGDFAEWVREAGLDAADERGRTLGLHGLRKAMARRLAEAGATPQSIMAVLGHSTIAMAAHYSAAYDRSRAADAGLAKLGEAPDSPVVRLERKRGDR